MTEKNTIFKTDNKTVSYFGDMHPKFSGSVVKALASAKSGITPLMETLLSAPSKKNKIDQLEKDLKATLVDRIQLAPNIIELVIHSPLAAKNFKPGQFYRLQNFEKTALVKKTPLPYILEPIALTGASVDKDSGLISLIVLQNGVSSKLCSTLDKGEEVILMGPTGDPTYIPKNKNVLLIGGGLGNAVLFSIGKALKEKNNAVTYIAAYKTRNSRFKTKEIEDAADSVYWMCEEDALLKNREQDKSFKGNVIDGLQSIKDNLKEIDYIIVIGSDKMMKAVALSRFSTLKDHFKKDPPLIGSINSPMQCMMKGICGQCVQVHKNPITEEDEIIFTCQSQDQNLKTLNFNCLNDRLEQNSLLEKIHDTFLSCIDSSK